MTLQFNVATLLREPVGSTREYEVDGDALVDEAAPRHQHVHGDARLLRTKTSVLVTAHLSGSQREPCSRCLLEIDVPVHIDIEEEFHATIDPQTGAVLRAPEDADAFRIDRQHNLNLEEATRQAWTAAAPMQPLCRSNCRGLCPRCGKDLNQGACSCRPEDDARWSALRQLAGKLEGD